MKKILLSTLIAGLWTGCSMEDGCPSGTGPEPGNEIKIDALIAEIAPASKTAYTGSTAAWKDDDAIGLFCPQATGTPIANNQFKVANTATTPVWSTASPIYWKDGTTSHKFLAYAPYAAGNDTYNSVKLPALNNQKGTIDPAADFLFSKDQWTTGRTRTGGAVPLTFTHALTLIEFDISINSSLAAGTTLTGFVLQSATVGDKLFTSDATSSTIDISTGTITAGTGVNTLSATVSPAITLSATPTAVYVLILPSTGYTTEPTLKLTLTENSSSIETASVSLGTKVFAGATKYKYAVAISRQAITISNPTITDWTTVNGNALNPGI